MKKIVAILLLVIYGSTSVGATVHLHYCMNEFVGWELWHDHTDEKCGKCGMMEQKGGCCKDEHKQLKIAADQNKLSVKSFVAEQISPAILPLTGYVHSLAGPLRAAPAFSKPMKGPGRWRNVPLYLSNRVFLI